MDGRLKDSSSYIYRLDPDLTCHKCAEDFSFICSNGIAFSPDDTRMYFGDTKGAAVHVFDLDIDEGRLHNRRLLYSLEHLKTGIIDGATVDVEGYYWFALNMGGKILRIDPKGRLDREINMPIPSPTCVTFGGDNLETMYVTSQQSFVSPEQLAMHPQPGSLFAIHGLGVRGLPEPAFGA
jgi:sugar lactone lactonase YvrE